MKDWVVIFLLNEYTDGIDEMFPDKNEKEQAVKDEIERLKDEEVVYHELADYFNYNFGLDEIGGSQDHIISVFGSVLADLPEDVFKKINSIKNLFWAFTSRYGAEVKCFRLENDSKARELIQVVTIPYGSSFLPFDAARGEIANALAHIYLEHKSDSNKEGEEEADEVAKSWGFNDEIEACRDYEANVWQKS